MLDLTAVRKAIEDVECAVTASAPPSRPRLAGDTLARLYSVYAQAVLQVNGIQVDLDDLCAQCCRDCPQGRCAREHNLS